MSAAGRRGSGNNDPRTVGRQYVTDRRITELFECLTAALVHDRPGEPIDFLLQCLDRVTEVGYENVFWDTFLPQIAPAQGPSLSARLAPGRSGSTVRFTAPVSSAEPAPQQQGQATQQRGVEATQHNAQQQDEHTREAQSQAPQQPRVDLMKDCTPGTVPASEAAAAAYQLSSQQEHPLVITNPPAQRQTSEAVPAAHITDPKLLAIYKGRLTDIPKLPTNTVRIFLSSTFSDFRAERNILPRKAYPELQTFCRERGLDFQVMDMRWGVTDEMLNDHQVTDLCVKEIENCQQVSCGPSFVTLLGNRYGYRPFPSVIEEEEFDILLNMCEELELAEQQLLSEWFIIDDNDVPPSYILQPIASKLVNFNNDSNKELYDTARESWKAISETLHSTLRKASQRACEKGDLPEETTAKYQISVTEQEIQHGMMKAANLQNRVICYSRQLHGLSESLDRKNTARFVDTIAPPTQDQPLQLDTDAQNRLNDLKINKIPDAIGVTDRQYPVEWKGVNLEDSTDEAHRQYLHSFCQQFVLDMKNMINQHLQNKDGGLDKEDTELYHEIVHHAKFANNKLALFCGREDALDQIWRLLMCESDINIPTVIYALSGHGKTSLLAKCASYIPQWIPGDVTVILRFLGTSPKCSNIRDTLLSVIGQMAALLDYTLPHKEKLEKMGDVRRYFNLLLSRIGEHHPLKRVVIILDSIDQLSELYGAHRLAWLPRTLPHNVHIIVSLLSDFGTLLSTCRNRISGMSNYIELEPLSTDTAQDIIYTYMTYHRRRITRDQQDTIFQSFTQNAQPLYLKLVLDRALLWNSYTPVDSIQMPSDVRDAIRMLFVDMKSKYGEVFVRHALSYISCGNGGLTDIEMDDILSCDDHVLNETYKYHDPPLEGTVRIPALLWARLGNELKEYLTEKQVDNKTIRTWYHRQFIEVAREHYLSDQTHLHNMHSNLGQLFLQTDGVRRTITLEQRKGKVIEHADRRVAPQVLTVQNLRKLNSLPYHLFRGKQFKSLTNECLLNFDFIFTKLKAVGITTLFAEFNEIVSVDALLKDPAVVLMKDFLELTYDALHLDPNLFPFFANDRLGSYVSEADYSALAPLVGHAAAWLKETDQPILLPVNPLNLTPLNSPVKFSQLLGFTGEVSSNEEVAVCLWKEAHSNRSKINVFDLLGRDSIASIDLTKESPSVITPDNRYFLLFNENKLCMYELYTGDKFMEIPILDKAYDNVSVRCLDISHDGRWLIIILKLGKPSGLQEGEAWKTQGSTYCVDMTTLEDDIKVVSKIYNSKRHIEKFIFIENNTKVVELKRDGIKVYSIPDLEEVCTHTIAKGRIMGTMGWYLPGKEVIVGPTLHDDSSNCFIYNCKDNTMIYSPFVHNETTDDIAEQLVSFGTIPKPDLSEIVFGTNSTGNRRESRLWVWTTSGTDVTRIVLSKGVWRVATVMVVMDDWEHVIVAYQSGDITLVSLSKQQQLRDVHAHGNIINTVKLYNHSQNLLTMGTDHSLKLWDMQKLFSTEMKTGRKADQAFGVVPLDTLEQVLEMEVNDTHAVTVSHLTKQGPRFWSLDTGMMDSDVTIAHEEIYNGVLRNVKQLSGPRYHGSIELIDEFVIYQRKRRDGFFLYVARAYGDFAPLGFEFFENSFFTLVDPGFSGCDPVIYLVRDGELEKRRLPGLQLISCAQIPRITDEIPNLESKNAKRKLIYYKVGLTVDGKRFLICNPSPGMLLGKYVDWVDTETMEYKGRATLPGTTSWKLLEDSFCFFVTAKNPNNPLVDEHIMYRPSVMSKVGEDSSVTYCSAIYGGLQNKGLLSYDHSIGLEVNRDYSMRIWNVSPLSRLATLRGHSSDVNSTCISIDNKFVVSGSFDNTVRLWSVADGVSLCLFHLHGNVSDVVLSPNNQYIAAKYYSAPQRTRAAVLKITNVDK